MKKAKEPNQKKIAELIKSLLVELGEDPTREGLKRTPERVARSLTYLTRGYRQNIKAVVNGAYFASGTNHMVILKNIELYSMCEHHLLPFFGKCHIGYIPKGQIFGVSKLARLVDMFARRLQIQERLCQQIAQAIFSTIHPQGVGVVMEAQHLCMLMRGVQKQNSIMTTSTMLGSFRKEQATRLEFLNLIKNNR